MVRPMSPENNAKTARKVRFNFRSEFGRLCENVTLSEQSAAELGIPHPAILLRPVQADVERWIYQKYIQYKRNYSAETILQNAREQIDIAAKVTNVIHPDYAKIFDQIYADLFSWQHMPKTANLKIQPVRKFCSACEEIKSVDNFDPVYYTADYLAVLCRPCTARKQATKLKQKNYQEIQSDEPLPVVPSADKLDNPDHDIDFDNLPSASEPDNES